MGRAPLGDSFALVMLKLLGGFQLCSHIRCFGGNGWEAGLSGEGPRESLYAVSVTWLSRVVGLTIWFLGTPENML